MTTYALPLPLLLLLSLFVATASARPCKTIFYFTATSTTTFYPHNNPNPNSFFRIQNPRYLTLIFSNPINFDNSQTMTSSGFPQKLYSSVSSTKDIMSVVGALLFGVGCGALTAAIMYFLWALFSPSRFDDDVTATKKKLGYLAIPTKVEEDLKKSAPPPKEVV